MDRWFTRGLVVVLLGLGLLAVPVTVMDTPSTTEAFVHVDKVGATQPQTSGDSIANYRNLDSSIQSVFDEGRTGMFARVDAEADAETLDQFSSQAYVEYAGAYYHVRYYHRPDSYTVTGAVALILTMLGGLAVVWGLLIAMVGTFKPFNSLSALGVPVVATLAIALSPAALTGGVGVPPIAQLIAFPPMALLFVGGALVGGGHLLSLFAIVGLVILSAIVGGFVVGTPVVVPFLFVGAVLAGGFPWLSLGWATRQPTT
jgi:hypothetical protein